MLSLIDSLKGYLILSWQYFLLKFWKHALPFWLPSFWCMWSFFPSLLPHTFLKDFRISSTWPVLKLHEPTYPLTVLDTWLAPPIWRMSYHKILGYFLVPYVKIFSIHLKKFAFFLSFPIRQTLNFLDYSLISSFYDSSLFLPICLGNLSLFSSKNSVDLKYIFIYFLIF